MTPHRCRVDRPTYDVMKQRYGRHASWAVWAAPRHGSRVGERVADLSPFELDDPLAGDGRLDALRRCTVLIALNSGVRAPGTERYEPWSMFHHPVGRDFMLADVLLGTPFWGAYVTDFFKGVPTRDGSGLADHLSEHPDVEARHASSLRGELSDLGVEGRATLVCLGRQVEPYVRRHFGDDHDVVRVSHYSRAMTKLDYRQEWEAIAPHCATCARDSV